jgi:protein-arginine deiminase
MAVVKSRRIFTASLVASLAVGCSDDGGGETGAATGGTTPPSPTGDTTADEPTGAATGDTGTAGETGDSDPTTGETGDPVDDEIPPIFGVPNLDDDDQNDKQDWFDADFMADDDVAVFRLPPGYVATLQPGERVALELAGELDAVRFWRGGAIALGHTGDAPATTHELTAEAAATAEFRVVFGDFLRAATLTVRRLDADATELARQDVPVRSAPLLTNHHLQPAERVYAVQAGSNAAMISTMHEVLGDRFVEVHNPDIWIQDELEWATVTAPGQRLDVAMDSIRDRQLDGWVKDLRAPDVEPITWGKAGTDTTEDKFGNLETTPPHAAKGVEYPFGRIYYGEDTSCGPNAILTDFLDRQRVQAPIRVDTCWLCVGHVDEFLSFIPDASAPRGFRFLIADVAAAYAVLDQMDPNTYLPRYADSHGYATVGELVDDNGLRALNLDLQADHIDPTRARFQSELELADEEILRIPALFEYVNGCSYKNNAVAALIPGMLNLTVVNFAGETPRIFVSDPFMRSDEDDPESDPLLTGFRAALPPEYEIHFVDDWYTYHVAIGEVHCGTNVARTPVADWWQDALHLIEEP